MNIFFIAAIIGLLLPTVCLIVVWKKKSLRNAILFFLAIQIIQIIFERILFKVELRHFIKYTATVFVVFRLWQLYTFKKLIHLIKSLPGYSKILLGFTYSCNIIIWAYILSRLIRKMIA